MKDAITEYTKAIEIDTNYVEAYRREVLLKKH